MSTKVDSVVRPLRLKPQPWAFTTERNSGVTIATRKPPTPVPLILPQLYCRETLPPSDAQLPKHHAPGTLELTEHSGVALIRNNVALDAKRSELIPPTFSRQRFCYHGGVIYLPEKEMYETRDPVDLRFCIHTDCPVYYADTEIPYVYGHVLLEALTRLWALDEVPGDVPIATSVKPDRTFERLLSCFGLTTDRILHIDRPVIAKSAFFPTIPLARRKWVHPAAWEVFDRLKTIAASAEISSAERIFLSRSRVSGRELMNQRQVEAYFKSKGFLVIHPQDLTIEDQIKLISSAKLIAGLGGSAMHNAVFASEGAKILVLCSEGWLVNVDTLLSQVPGRLGYVFGHPVEPPEAGHRTISAWRIDLNDVKDAVRRHFDLSRDGPLHAVKYGAMLLRGRGNEIPATTSRLHPGWAE
ncbi:MAG TPA: glycosyltransferase 61 family protein [Anaerolineales bacterium]|nr:glycosyltransferase 61 family protein [Anaerolineales bacterium]